MTDIDQARMGVAVLIDHETCLNYLGLRCDVCYRVCPLIDKAITLELQHNQRTGKHAMFLPTVHSDVCTGCGKCEHACVLEEAAIRWCLASSPRGDWPPLPARLGREGEGGQIAHRRQAHSADPQTGGAMSRYPGAEATARLGWWRSHRFLLLRRLCQFGVLTLFLLGPLAGIWILRGNLSSSLLLETVPLTDPLTLLQSLAAGHWPIPTLWLGPSSCCWVTGWSGAGVLLLGLSGQPGHRCRGLAQGATWSQGQRSVQPHHRYWLLAMVLVAPAIAGVLVWELVNPVSLILRGLLFGMGRAGPCWRCCSCSTSSWWSGAGAAISVRWGPSMPWSTGSGSSRFLPRARAAATAWIVMQSARNVPSCAAPFTVPSVVWALDCGSGVYQLRPLHRCLRGASFEITVGFAVKAEKRRRTHNEEADWSNAGLSDGRFLDGGSPRDHQQHGGIKSGGGARIW